MRNSEGRQGPVPIIYMPFNYDVTTSSNSRGERVVIMTLETVQGTPAIAMKDNCALDLGHWLVKMAKEIKRPAEQERKSGLLLPDRELVLPVGD